MKRKEGDIGWWGGSERWEVVEGLEQFLNREEGEGEKVRPEM